MENLVLDAKEILRRVIEGLKALEFLVRDMPGGEIKSLLKSSLFSENMEEIKGLEAFLLIQEGGEEDLKKRAYIFGLFISFLKSVLREMDGIRDRISNFKSLSQLFPEDTGLYTIYIVRYNIMLAIYNLDKVSRMLREKVDVEVEFEEEETE